MTERTKQKFLNEGNYEKTLSSKTFINTTDMVYKNFTTATSVI